MAITTPFKRLMHAEMPAYQLPSPPPTERGLLISIGDFNPKKWAGFSTKSSDAPLLPVLWSEDFWKYYVLDNLAYIFQAAPIKWGAKGTLLSLPRAILCDNNLIPTVIAAAASLGDAFVKKNILIATDPRSGAFTSGLPWHGVQIVDNANLAVVFPDRFIAGEVLSLCGIDAFANYIDGSVSAGDLRMSAAASTDADTAGNCFSRFANWGEHFWVSRVVLPAEVAAYTAVFGQIANLVSGFGWGVDLVALDRVYSPTVSDVTPVIKAFFGI